jgi:hypothetical protein
MPPESPPLPLDLPGRDEQRTPDEDDHKRNAQGTEQVEGGIT